MQDPFAISRNQMNNYFLDKNRTYKNIYLREGCDSAILEI